MHKSESNKINDDTFSRESREEDLLEAFELNYKLLSHFQFYSTQNISEFINESLQSNIVANTIVEKIVNDGSKILYDKYVGTKMPQHVLNHSKEYLEMLNELEFRTHDQSELGVETLEEDQEPVTHGQDSWVRNKINVERKPPNIREEVENANNNLQEKEPSESKYSYIKSNASRLVNKSDIIKESKKTEMKPVLLPEEIKTVFDPLEEQVRMKKEREMKLKEEKTQEAKHRQEEVKEQQYKLKGINNENAKKNYTYDYEGNIKVFQAVKVEKLPPSNYTMIVDFSTFDPNSKTEDDKNKTKGKNQPKPVMPVSKPTTKIDNQSKFIPSPTIFDNFNANPGVTLIEGGRTKTYTGPKLEKSALNIMSLSNNLNETNPIRLSKNEYMQLTRGGNLSRSQNYSSSTNEKEKKQSKLYDEPTKNNISNTNLIQETQNASNMSEGLKDMNIQVSRLKHKKKDAKASNIKILSNKMLHSLVEEIDDTLSFPKVIEKIEKNEEITKTPIDEFNMHILRSKDWGKSSNIGGFLPVLKIGFKPGSKEFERTLGKKAKNPRDRQLRGSNFKDEAGYGHLGPPMIGKVAGHGINTSGLS